MLASPSLNHLIRPRYQRGRDRQAERLGGLEVNHQLEPQRLLDRQIAWSRPFEDAIDVGGRPTHLVILVDAVSHQATALGKTPEVADRRELLFQRQFRDRARMGEGQRRGQND